MWFAGLLAVPDPGEPTTVYPTNIIIINMKTGTCIQGYMIECVLCRVIKEIKFSI
jgi:hypothetical protein